MTEVVKAIERAENVLVVGHVMPDGDDISSVLTLSMGLRRLGKKTLPGIDYKIPYIFEETPWIEEIVDFDGFENSGFDPDLVVIVDVSSPDRIGRFVEILEDVSAVVVDHHKTNEGFVKTQWVDPSFGACAQMVLRINEELGVEYDEKLSHVNLLGILTDTGFLRFQNADVRVYEDATKLVKMGANPHEISKMVLENKRPEQFKLFAEVLEKMKLEVNGLLAYSYITSEMYERHGCTDEDSSGFVHELRSMRGVEVAVMFMEYRPGEVHVSMRSKDWFDVSEIAVMFGGGGHPRAAGITLKDTNVFDTMNKVVPQITRSLASYLSR